MRWSRTGPGTGRPPGWPRGSPHCCARGVRAELRPVIGDLRDTIGPRDYRVFADVVERPQWPLAGRLFFWALGGRFGESRDWDELEAWADGIARAPQGGRERARARRSG